MGIHPKMFGAQTGKVLDWVEMDRTVWTNQIPYSDTKMICMFWNPPQIEPWWRLQACHHSPCIQPNIQFKTISKTCLYVLPKAELPLLACLRNRKTFSIGKFLLKLVYDMTPYTNDVTDSFCIVPCLFTYMLLCSFSSLPLLTHLHTHLCNLLMWSINTIEV